LIPVILALLWEQGYEDPWLFFKARRGSSAKEFSEHWSRGSVSGKGKTFFS
jgi:hypothetical protein